MFQFGLKNPLCNASITLLQITHFVLFPPLFFFFLFDLWNFPASVCFGRFQDLTFLRSIARELVWLLTVKHVPFAPD